ncbi:MAG: nucleotide exchange factor GrpE [Betaproteobacteria bacterium TMED82]|nr:MAG: nucleotide exchange factor GrpE [Betaproteobacteria bacterium TMED82]
MKFLIVPQSISGMSKEKKDPYKEVTESLDSVDGKSIGNTVDTAEFGIKSDTCFDGEDDGLKDLIDDETSDGDGCSFEDALETLSLEKEKSLRLQADLENLRKRLQIEVSNASKYAIESFAESLLPVADSLEAALSLNDQSIEDFKSGVELTLKQLNQAFSRGKLEKISPGVGEKFDPNHHQAVSTQPSGDLEHPVMSGGIVRVLQTGYSISGRIIRPALVIVAD